VIEGLAALRAHSRAVVAERAIGRGAAKHARNMAGFAADVLVGAREQEARRGVIEVGLLSRCW